MITEWSKISSMLPDKDKRVLVYHKLNNYVDICSLVTNPWSLKLCWEDDNGIYCAMETSDLWCHIPYPTSIEINLFDKTETYDNCTVEILTNTITGEQSIGWWKNN